MLTRNLNFNRMRKKNISIEENSKIKVYFDDLEKHLIDYISKSSYVMGCVAWLTNRNIIDALDNTKGTKIIVNKEEFLSTKMKEGQKFFYKCLRGKYNDIPDIFESQCSCCLKKIKLCANFTKTFGTINQKNGAILTCGIVNNLSKMHHKFLIFLDDNLSTVGVWTGSYNLSKNSNNSLENALYITEPDIIMAYVNEFLSIYSFSEPFDWYSGLLCDDLPNSNH